MGVRRRHDLVWVLRENPNPRLAVVEVARHDGLRATAPSGGTFMSIEPQFSLSRVCIRPVTGETFICKDGPDIPGKVGRGKGGPGEKNRACEFGDNGSAHLGNLSRQIPG